MANSTPEKNSSTSTSIISFLKKLIIPIPNETPSPEIRNILLVAATLIAAVTFQAGVNPPGGVWQDNERDIDREHVAGHAIYASQRKPFYVFLIFNTLALSSSIFLLLSLTFGFPFFLEVLIATISMGITYGSAIYCVTPDEAVRFRLIFLAAAVPIVMRVTIWLLAKVDARRKTSASAKLKLKGMPT